MNNLEDILKEYNIETKLAGEHHHVTSEGWIAFDCPFCSPRSGRFRCGFHPTNNFVKCWSCGWHPLKETLIELLDELPSKVQSLTEGIIRDFTPKPKIKGKLLLPKELISVLPVHKKYIKERGLKPEEIIQLWKIQGIGIAPKLAWRIFIPINDHHGNTISWTTRAITDNTKRYINAKAEQESQSAKEVLFGEEYCNHSIIITEGPFDVFKFGPGAVATLGLEFNHHQLNRMIRYPVRIVCLDNDDQAQKRAKYLCNQLSSFPGKTINIRLDSKDLGSATKKELTKVRSLIQ